MTVRKNIKNYLSSALPLPAFGRLYQTVVRFQRDTAFQRISLRGGEDHYVASWPDGGELAFASLNRLGRCLRPGGRQEILDRMLNKYVPKRDVLTKGMTVIDVGANVGEFSLALAPWEPAQLLAVEPDPSNRPALRANLSRFESAEIVSTPLADKPGRMVFYMAHDEADSSVVEPTSHSGSFETDVITMTHLIEQHVDGGVDLVKLDAEGFEPEVLRGSREVFPRIRRWAIDVTLERDGVSTADPVVAILRENGYTVEVHNGVAIGLRDD